MADEQTLNVWIHGTVTIVTAEAHNDAAFDWTEVIIDQAIRNAEQAGGRVIGTPRVEWHPLTAMDVLTYRAMLDEQGFPPDSWRLGDWLVTTRCRVVAA